MASLSNRVSIDTNVIFLRSIFAFSTNNVPVSTNFIMGAGPNGMIYAQDTLQNLEAYGVGYLPSTFSTIDGQIASTSLQLISGNVTAPALTSTTNYLLSTICSVQSNVNTLSSGLSSVMGSTFTSFAAQTASLNSSFTGYVVAGSVSASQLTSTTNGVLSIESTNNGTLSNYVIGNFVNNATFSNLSTGVSTQSNYFSVQVVQLSNNFTALSNFTRIQLSNQSSQISTITNQVNTFSTLVSGFSSAITATQFQGLSTYVLGQSTTIRNISDSLSTNWSNTSNVSSYVISLSTSVGTRIDGIGGGGFVTTAQFEGLSTFVLGQSTTIRNVSDSLSTNWRNTSNVSTFVVSLSTSVGTRIDGLGGGGITSVNSQTGPAITIQAGTNITISNPSADVIQINASGGGGGTTISTNILFGTGNFIAAANTIVGGQSNISFANRSGVFGSNNLIGATASNSFACGENNIVAGANNVVFGTQNNFDEGVENSIIVGRNNYTSAAGTLTVGHYAKSRVPGSITNAGIGPLYDGINVLTGFCQTYITTLLSKTSFAIQSNSFTYFLDKINTTGSNIRFGNDGTNANFLTGVKLDIYGYEGKDFPGLAGDGVFYATYEYALYRDNTLSETYYICDIIANTRTQATASPTSVLITASRTVNFLRGTPTVNVYIVMDTSGRYYRISITNTTGSNPINYIARLQASDILQGR
jgi:hypothetical protein